MSPRKTFPEKPFSLGIFVGIYFTDGSLCLPQSPFAAINNYPAKLLSSTCFPSVSESLPSNDAEMEPENWYKYLYTVEKALVDPFHTPESLL